MPSSYGVGEHFEAFIKSQIRQGRRQRGWHPG